MAVIFPSFDPFVTWVLLISKSCSCNGNCVCWRCNGKGSNIGWFCDWIWLVSSRWGWRWAGADNNKLFNCPPLIMVLALPPSADIVRTVWDPNSDFMFVVWVKCCVSVGGQNSVVLLISVFKALAIVGSSVFMIGGGIDEEGIDNAEEVGMVVWSSFVFRLPGALLNAGKTTFWNKW